MTSEVEDEKEFRKLIVEVGDKFGDHIRGLRCPAYP